ncbi:hypothetical protein Tco_0024023 [Tanacetum coccineum]
MDLNAFIRIADTLDPHPVQAIKGIGDASVGDGGDQGFDSAVGQENVEPSVPVTDLVEAEVPKPNRSKKKRVIYDSEGLPVSSHPPKRLRVDYGTAGGSPTLSFTLEEGGDRTDSVTGPSLRTIGLPRVYSRCMTEAITVCRPTVAIPLPRTWQRKEWRSDSGFEAGSIRAEETVGAGTEEIYVPEWTVTKGFEMNDGRLCANMIDHFTPPAFFKTVRGMEHEQLFTELKEEWRSLAEEKNILLEAKDKEIERIWKSQLLKRQRRFPAEVTQLRAQMMLAAGYELKGSAGRCLTDLKAYIPSAENDFNSAICDLRDLNFPLLQELFNKNDASTWVIMDLLRLDDTVAETLDVFVSIDDPLFAEALIEPPTEVPSTNVLSTVVIIPHAEPSVSVEDYDKPDSYVMCSVRRRCPNARKAKEGSLLWPRWPLRFPIR